jgi:hypothetical protein
MQREINNLRLQIGYKVEELDKAKKQNVKDCE